MRGDKVSQTPLECRIFVFHVNSCIYFLGSLSWSRSWCGSDIYVGLVFVLNMILVLFWSLTMSGHGLGLCLGVGLFMALVMILVGVGLGLALALGKVLVLI